MDRKKFEELHALEQFTGPAKPVLKPARLSLQVQLNMERQRVAKLERLLMACYLKYPRLHYDNCSDYARDMLFHPPDADGNVQYIDPSVQTVEPPF